MTSTDFSSRNGPISGRPDLNELLLAMGWPSEHLAHTGALTWQNPGTQEWPKHMASLVLGDRLLRARVNSVMSADDTRLIRHFQATWRIEDGRAILDTLLDGSGAHHQSAGAVSEFVRLRDAIPARPELAIDGRRRVAVAPGV